MRINQTDKPLFPIDASIGLPVVPQIQVTMDCNLNCGYCFEKHTHQYMDLTTAEAILRRTVEHNQKAAPDAPVQVYWHGGEPLLAGADFFHSVVRLQSKINGVRFENRIQTNGTLMTEELADFFHRHKFSVGFSLDGPRDLHDRHRTFRHSGKGSFFAAMKGLQRYLRRNPSVQPAVIAVITRHSMNRVDEIYHFFNVLGARVQLDIYDLRVRDMGNDGEITDAARSLLPDPKSVGAFLIRLFDHWFYDSDGMADFNELRQEVKMTLRPDSDCGDPYHKRRCDFRRVIFTPGGDAFSCDQYVNDAGTALGNIHRDSLADISLQKIRLWEEIKTHIRISGKEMACNLCQWGRQCPGGCLTCMKYNAALLSAREKGLSDNQWHRFLPTSRTGRLQGETYYCEGLRAFRNHVRKAVDASYVRS